MMIELLKKFNIFDGMGPKELQQIAPACRLRGFQEGAQVFRAGDPAESLFMVNKGKIELRFKVSYHKVSTELSLDKVSEGDAFGWSALTYPFKYTLSAFVAQESELVEIKESDVKRICQENPQVGYILMNNIARIIGQRFSAIQEMLIQEIQEGLKKKESLS